MPFCIIIKHSKWLLPIFFSSGKLIATGSEDASIKVFIWSKERSLKWIQIFGTLHNFDKFSENENITNLSDKNFDDFLKIK